MNLSQNIRQRTSAPGAALAYENRELFLEAMSSAVTGVNVVTTDGPAGRMGVTVSAVSSVSADPPLVLVCINRRSPVGDAILGNGVFCINLLSTCQRYISDTFAGRSGEHEPYDFACAHWLTGKTGSPRLDGAVSAFDCVLDGMHNSGSHTIFIGKVVEARSDKGSPLLYVDRQYGRASPWRC